MPEPEDDIIRASLRAEIAKTEERLKRLRRSLAEYESIDGGPQPERYEYSGMRLGEAALLILKKWNRPASYGEIIDELSSGGTLQDKSYPAVQVRKALDRQLKLGTIKHTKDSRPVVGGSPRRVNENEEFYRRVREQIVELA